MTGLLHRQEEFLRESEIMLNFNHINLVRLIGVAVQQRPWLCVLEYMEVRRRALAGQRDFLAWPRR